MADVTMNSATIPNIVPDTADLLLAWDASAAANGEFPISALNTLLTATFATLAGGNTFTGDQNISGNIITPPADLGASVKGRNLWLQRNSNAAPAPGVILITQSNNTTQRIWPDDSGNLRIGALDPVGASINSGGVVVGTQTSAWDQKDLLSDAPPDPVDVLAAIAEGAASVRRFWYKPYTSTDDDGNVIVGGRPGYGEQFSGVVLGIPDGPNGGRYGMDRDEAHPQGKILNDITAIGDLLVAVNYLSEQLATALLRIEALELAGETG